MKDKDEYVKQIAEKVPRIKNISDLKKIHEIVNYYYIKRNEDGDKTDE